MNTDSAFVIGKTHKVCQDYTSHGLEIYLADGCSSSPDTDIGARLLVRAARMFDIDGQYSATDIIYRANHWRQQIDLLPTSLDATLLRASVTNNIYTARMYGDGVIAIKEHNRARAVHVYSVSYEGNAPQYLSYDLDMERRTLWNQYPDNTRAISRYISTGAEYTLVGVKEDSSSILELSGSIEDYEWIALMSDGVHSFTDSGMPVPIIEVLPLLLDFKNLNGEFVQRRMARFQKDIATKGWVHNDDLSLAVINLGE